MLTYLLRFMVNVDQSVFEFLCVQASSKRINRNQMRTDIRYIINEIIWYIEGITNNHIEKIAN